MKRHLLPPALPASPHCVPHLRTLQVRLADVVLLRIQHNTQPLPSSALAFWTASGMTTAACAMGVAPSEQCAAQYIPRPRRELATPPADATEAPVCCPAPSAPLAAT